MLDLILLISAFVYYFGAGWLAMELDWEINTPVFILVYVIIAIIISVMFKGNATKCPKCGRKFAMKEISRILIGSKDTFAREYRSPLNSKGFAENYTKYVPAEDRTYDCVDECKYCKYRRTAVRTETTKNYKTVY